MNNTSHIKSFFLLSPACLFSMVCFAQKDTARKQTIDITSSYKPVLRNAVKINFSATHLIADTSKSVGPYKVPPQNLFYTYQPASLRPLAITQDSNLNLGIRNFLKAGFGNYSTPYVSAGFSFGDGKTALVNIYGDYISSKGSVKNQDYVGLNLKAPEVISRRTMSFTKCFCKTPDYYYMGTTFCVRLLKGGLLHRIQH